MVKLNEFYAFYRKAVSKRANEISITEPYVLYQQASEQHMIPPLPTIAKIIDYEWDLWNYSLNQELCNCIQAAFKQSFQTVKRVYLENNNLDDDSFSSFLISFKNQKKISSIYYSHNRFGEKSAHLLIDYIKTKELKRLSLNNLVFERNASSVFLYGLC